MTAPALRARVGNRPGACFQIKVVGGTSERVGVVDNRDPRVTIYMVEVAEFTRVAARLTGREMGRLFILEPADVDSEYVYGDFFVAGRFRIVEKVNNARAAAERWKSFA